MRTRKTTETQAISSCRGMPAKITSRGSEVQQTMERNMADASVAQALAGQPAENNEVTIKGWIRTRRDSKGGFSFLTVNDGSCFDSIQVVAPGELPNYQSEVTKITTGCSVIVTG